MLEERTAQPPATDGSARGTVTEGYMARYDIARRQSVRDVLLAYGGIDPAESPPPEETLVATEIRVPSAAESSWSKTRSLARRVIAACRWAYELVAL